VLTGIAIVPIMLSVCDLVYTLLQYG